MSLPGTPPSWLADAVIYQIYPQSLVDRVSIAAGRINAEPFSYGIFEVAHV